MKNRISRLSRAMTFAAGAVLTLAALPGTVLAAEADDTLTVAFGSSLTTVDRLYSTQREGLILSRLTDDGLFMVDPETLKFVPLAAESYSWVDDTTLDVTLRQDVRFHDGSPLTADDVIYTYEWMVADGSNTDRGPVIKRWLESVEKLGEHKVRFNLKMPYPMAVRDMAISVMLRKQGTYDQGAEPELLHNGIGPYKVVEFNAGREIVIERFDDYYASSPKGEPAIGRMVFRIIPDEGTQQAELLSGGVDFLFAVGSDIAENIGMAPNVDHLVGPDMRVAYITMDAAGYTGKDNPFTRLEVRRAFNHAIDREAIVRELVRGSGKVVHTACNPVQFGCVQDVRRYEYNPEKARQLLAEAGYPDGFRFDLWAYRDKPVAEAIVGDLQEIGVDARLKFVKLSVFAKARNSREMSAFFASYGGGGTADASAIAGVHFAPDSSRNYSGDAAVSETMVAAERYVDPDRRLELYREALTRIADQAYWVPLYSYTQNYLVSTELAFPVPKDGVPRLWRAHWK
jgi:peptide/nickel transport system substrate-binding protein